MLKKTTELGAAATITSCCLFRENEFSTQGARPRSTSGPHHNQKEPQSNVLGWSGLVMSRPMYQMLSTSPFRLPTDPGPQAVYYGARVPILDSSGNPVNDATRNPT